MTIIYPMIMFRFPAALVQQFHRDIAPVLCNFLEHGLMEPGIHLRRIIHQIGGASKFSRKFLAGFIAAVNVEQFQEIDDRYLPVKLLLRYEYDTAEYLTRVSCPVLIVHSRDDEIMPFDQGWQLFEVAKVPKKFLEITGTHNEGFITSGKAHEEGLNAFIREHMP